MIKFFRKIRQNLLSEGKNGKYLKYALGEIILVVIGILIALQINTWNENRKTHNLIKNSLTRILSELEVDINAFEKKINSHNEFMQKNDSIYNNFISLNRDENLILTPWDFHTPDVISSNNQTFTEMQNIGSFYAIDDIEIAEGISKYYKFCDDFKFQFQMANKKIEDSRDNPKLQKLWTLQRRLKIENNQVVDLNWLYDINSDSYIALVSFFQEAKNGNWYKRRVLVSALEKAKTLKSDLNEYLKLF